MRLKEMYAERVEMIRSRLGVIPVFDEDELARNLRILMKSVSRECTRLADGIAGKDDLEMIVYVVKGEWPKKPITEDMVEAANEIFQPMMKLLVDGGTATI